MKRNDIKYDEITSQKRFKESFTENSESSDDSGVSSCSDDLEIDNSIAASKENDAVRELREILDHYYGQADGKITNIHHILGLFDNLEDTNEVKIRLLRSYVEVFQTTSLHNDLKNLGEALLEISKSRSHDLYVYYGNQAQISAELSLNSSLPFRKLSCFATDLTASYLKLSFYRKMWHSDEFDNLVSKITNYVVNFCIRDNVDNESKQKYLSIPLEIFNKLAQGKSKFYQTEYLLNIFSMFLVNIYLPIIRLVSANKLFAKTALADYHNKISEICDAFLTMVGFKIENFAATDSRKQTSKIVQHVQTAELFEAEITALAFFLRMVLRLETGIGEHYCHHAKIVAAFNNIRSIVPEESLLYRAIDVSDFTEEGRPKENPMNEQDCESACVTMASEFINQDFKSVLDATSIELSRWRDASQLDTRQLGSNRRDAGLFKFFCQTWREASRNLLHRITELNFLLQPHLNIGKTANDLVSMIQKLNADIALARDFGNKRSNTLEKRYVVASCALAEYRLTIKSLDTLFQYLDSDVNEQKNYELLKYCEELLKKLDTFDLSDATFYFEKADVNETQIQKYREMLSEGQLLRLKYKYEQLETSLLSKPLTLKYGTKHPLLIPFLLDYQLPKILTEKAARGYMECKNISAHAVTLVYSVFENNRCVKKTATQELMTAEGEPIFFDSFTGDSAERLNSFKSKSQAGWERLTRLQSNLNGEPLFLAANSAKNPNSTQKLDRAFKHSEQHAHFFLHQGSTEDFVTKFAEQNPDFQPGCKVYMVVYDMVGEHECCHGCKLMLFNELDRTSRDSFTGKLENYFRNNGYQLPSDSQQDNNGGLRSAARIFVNRPYYPPHEFTFLNAYTPPKEKNIKLLKNMGIFEARCPTLSVSGSSYTATGYSKK